MIRPARGGYSHPAVKTAINYAMTLRLVVIGGDGTGPEVTGQALKVLEAVARAEGLAFASKAFDFGARRLHRGSEAAVADLLREFIMLFLKPKRARHAATTGIDFADLVSRRLQRR